MVFQAFTFFQLLSFGVLAVCFGSLSCCIIKFFPISLDAFLRKLADRMFLQTYEYIWLLPSWVKSSIKISEPTPEAAMQVQAMKRPPPCFTDELVCFRSWADRFFLSPHFSLSITLVEVNHGFFSPSTFVPELLWLISVLFLENNLKILTSDEWLVSLLLL